MIRYATISGNWSNPLIWNGGLTIPSAGDDVYANGFTVSCNQSFTVTKISTEVCPTTSVGGGVFTTGNYTYTCNVVAGTTRCVSHGGGTTGIFVGNVYGGTSPNAMGIYANNLSSITIVGNLLGGSAALASALEIYNSVAIVITGNITGGSVGYGVLRGLGAPNFTITGNIIAGVVDAFRSVATNINMVGNVTASATAHGIYGDTIYPSLLNITGQLVNYQDKLAVANYSRIYFKPSTSTAWTFYDSDNVAKPLYTADVLENPPAVTDVRDGVVYGISSGYTGTCAVPPPASVVKNVPVDNTVGTWAFDTTLITRLEKCSTVDITQSQLTAFLNS